MKYWLNLFSPSSWQKYNETDHSVSGFRANRWTTVQKIKVGDRFICYLTGISAWIGLFEIIDKPFFDDQNRIWDEDMFPARLKVNPLIMLTPETAVPIKSLSDKLSIFNNLKNPNAWTGRLRGSPQIWSNEDAKIIEDALYDAEKNPVKHELDIKKLRRKSPYFINKSENEIISIPEDNEEEEVTKQSSAESINKHDEIQMLLAELANKLGLKVWIARNDRNKVISGKKFTDLENLADTIPGSFDEQILKTIELIDVLWIKDRQIVSAFEIESTTTIWSGLLRMSDLVVETHGTLNIPLYIVAPESRFLKVKENINRPIFSATNPKIADVCQFISFESLHSEIKKASDYLSKGYFDIRFIQDIAEDCGPDN